MAISRKGSPEGTPSKPANRRRGEATAPVKAPKPPLPAIASPGPPSSRAARAAERRAAIIDAAMDEFIARGYAATRLDDVAKRAGVAKGTIYLHFKDKESMFEELIRTAIVPLIGRLATPPLPGGSVRDALETFAQIFVHEVATTRRGAMIELAVARGEVRQPELARFPQIIVAPAIIAVIWKSLFERHSPLDAIAMFRVHLDLIFGERRPA